MKARISSHVKFFTAPFLNKYNLTEYTDEIYEPVVMFGMYNSLQADRDFYINHKGDLIVIWVGNDAKTVNKEFIKQRSAKHIATSKFISDSLSGIDHIILPITPVKPVINIKPNTGNFIYHYGDRPIYKKEWIPEIEHRTGLKVIHANHESFSKEELEKIYEQCFIGLRLTEHDGISCTVLELGLMGRRSIFNGGYPTNISWESIDDVCQSILYEYNNRSDPHIIATKIYNYLDIGDSWLK